MVTVESIKLSKEENDRKCGDEKQYKSIFFIHELAVWLITGQDGNEGKEKAVKDFTSDPNCQILRSD